MNLVEFFLRLSLLTDCFAEMMRTADELRVKIAKFKTRRMEETEHFKKMRLDHQKNDFSMVDRSTGKDSLLILHF